MNEMGDAMTREELRRWKSGHFCGCGAPRDACDALTRLLDGFSKEARYGQDDRHVRKAPYEELPKWITDDGVVHLLLYWLDRAGLMEHGGSVLAGWLTDEGERVLAGLKRESADEFEALCKMHCICGFDVEDSSHDCDAWQKANP